MMDRHIGAQLYTTRKEMQDLKGFEEGLKKLAKVGYSKIQISAIPLPAKDLRRVADEYGMQIIFSHRAFADFQKDLQEIMDYNAALGCDSCCIGSAPSEYLKSNDSVSAFIEEMNKMADVLHDNGFFFGYHNHSYEFAKFNGKTIMDRFLTETDPDKVKLVLDTYWVQAGGKNPAKFIREAGKRAELIHFKDYRVIPANNKDREFAEIGEGNLDWDDIIAACDEVGARIAMVEQDDTYGRDPYESLAMSYNFLKTKGFM